MKKPSDLTEEYWERLGEENRALYARIRPIMQASYVTDNHLTSIETTLAQQERDMVTMGGSLNLNPDYQRGHVWTEQQQISFVEALFKGTAPRRIMFNCPNWDGKGEEKGDIPPYTFECIDGLQRLTAVRKFMADEIAIFGDLTASKLKGTAFTPNTYRLQFEVYSFAWREDLLAFYIALNSGGTQHPASEIDRVKGLLAEAQKPETPSKARRPGKAS